jgi:hypothetical protein
MTAVLEEVAAGVEALFAGQAIRWPDPPDVHAELVAILLTASPPTVERVVGTLRILVDGADTLTQLVDALDVIAIRFGQDGDGETCAALLDVSDRLREWRDRG